jgi:hypothetical protein
MVDSEGNEQAVADAVNDELNNVNTNTTPDNNAENPHGDLTLEQERVAIEQLAEAMRKIREKYGLTEQEAIMDINLVKEIQINGRFEYKDVYALLLKNAKGEVYNKLVRQNGSNIATLKKGKYTLAKEEIAKWEEKGIEIPDDLKPTEEDEKDEDEKELEHEIDDFEGKGDKKEEDKEKTQAEMDLNAAKVPKVEKHKGERRIVSVIKIGDTKDFGKAVGIGIPEGQDVYIARYSDNTTSIIRGDWERRAVHTVKGMESTSYSMNFLRTMGLDKAESNEVIEMENNIETYKPRGDLNYTYTVVPNPLDRGRAIVIINNGMSNISRRFEIEWGPGVYTVKDVEEQLINADSRTDGRAGENTVGDILEAQNVAKDPGRETPDGIVDMEAHGSLDDDFKNDNDREDDEEEREFRGRHF